MSKSTGWAGWALFNMGKGPWGAGGKGSGGGDNGGGSEPPKGPWFGGGGQGGPQGPGGPGKRNVTSLDEWLGKNRARFGGGKGGVPGRPDGSILMWGFIGLILVVLIFSSFHQIQPEQRGVLTRFGRYVDTLSPGVSITLPAPISRVEKVNVEEVREIKIGAENSERLMLTGDENIIDIEYIVRWRVREPEQYLFELANPEDTVRQVAESAMRQVIANSSLQDAIGGGRSAIQAAVVQEMQETLDAYEAGIEMSGVEINRADPPAEVNEAFKDVTAAQQDAQSSINEANAYALQLTARAQGEAEAFNRVYEEYRLAPEVTQRRMYYETMEAVLKGVDKTIIQADGVQPYLPLSEVNRGARSTSQGGQ
ncbi:FtsH protease activity modulator HflK [Sphingomicrobium sediminis]|uniref:Protein HflK n=1 Tax=Sphingomicrobium sediminis TaxID=2950949 RepID=A0A9X2ELJ3_9SPHN|nr:FtsH protease activity modulator HflK [Sphingomicrobium sediminis]MCM8557642.1 FtsH protease activity modulator HflK [Sphingomicrobium sediminis]